MFLVLHKFIQKGTLEYLFEFARKCKTLAVVAGPYEF